MAEQAYVANPIAAAGGRVIASPFQFVSDEDTNLMIVSVCSVLGVTLAVQGRRIDEAGRVVPFVETHTPNTNRSTKAQFYKLGKGALLNLTVFALTGTPLVGQCYVSIRIIQGFTGATVVLGTLLGGYVTLTQALGFPGSVIVSSTDGEPAVREIGGTLPPAGGNISEVVPAGARWEMLTLCTVFSTSAVAGTRVVFLFLDSPVDIFGVSTNPIGLGPGANSFIVFGGGQQANTIANASMLVAPLPSPNVLTAGQRFRTVVPGLDPADNFQQPIFTVKEWLEVP